MQTTLAVITAKTVNKISIFVPYTFDVTGLLIRRLFGHLGSELEGIGRWIELTLEIALRLGVASGCFQLMPWLEVVSPWAAGLIYGLAQVAVSLIMKPVIKLAKVCRWVKSWVK